MVGTVPRPLVALTDVALRRSMTVGLEPIASAIAADRLVPKGNTHSGNICRLTCRPAVLRWAPDAKAREIAWQTRSRSPEGLEVCEQLGMADIEPRRFLLTEVCPGWRTEALDPDKLDRFDRYEINLVRKFDRYLIMLFRLKDLRRGAIAG